MRIIKILMISITLFAMLVLGYHAYRKYFRYDVEDWIIRLNAPHFMATPDSFEKSDQASVVDEFQRRGFTLDCYGNLQTENKIDKETDYLCSAPIKSAYDNIPARLVTFFFSKNRLQHVRIEFPERSFDKVQNYLERRLAQQPRLDKVPGSQFSTDIFGNAMMVWGVKDGVVITNGSAVAGQPTLVLWSNILWRQSPLYNQ